MASNGVTDTKFEDQNHFEALRQIQTGASIAVPRDMFEKLYLSPKTKVKGDLRKTFANPTPLCLAGFLVSSTPLACTLMGWRGAGGGGAATLGVFLFMGGMLQVIGAVLEFVLGNTFSFVVFSTFGGFWLAFGTTLQPSSGTAAAFEASGGHESPVFAASFAFFLISMAVLCTIYLICSVRTNVVLVFALTCIVLAFIFLAASYWQLANGNVSLFGKLQKGGGALIFVLSMAVWYLFAAQLLEAVDFPVGLPVGDLSTVIKGRSSRVRARQTQGSDEP